MDQDAGVVPDQYGGVFGGVHQPIVEDATGV